LFRAGKEGEGAGFFDQWNKKYYPLYYYMLAKGKNISADLQKLLFFFDYSTGKIKKY